MGELFSISFPSCVVVPPTEDGWIWDSANTILSLAALLISGYSSWSSGKIREFDDRFGNRLVTDCGDIRALIDEIWAIALIRDQVQREQAANEILDSWNDDVLPFLNSADILDKQFLKDGKVPQCAKDISDKIADMLDTYNANYVGIWHQDLRASMDDATKLLDEMHVSINAARKKSRQLFKVF